MKYITVFAKGYPAKEVLNKLEEMVNLNIRSGYKPLGGISITTTEGLCAAQAMIKEEE